MNENAVTSPATAKGLSEKEMADGLRKLLCSNAQIFEETVRFLGQQNARLHDQVSGLTQLSLSLPRNVAGTSVEAEDERKLMRINAQMFEGTISVLGKQNTSLLDQVSALTTEILALLQPGIVIEACSKQDEA
jgi:hypothetical protein